MIYWYRPVILYFRQKYYFIYHSVIINFYFSLQLYNKGKLPILDTERWVRSPQVTVIHRQYRLPLLSTRPAVTFSAAEHHRPLVGTKLYCLVTEEHRCEQLAQGCYAALTRVGFEPATY